MEDEKTIVRVIPGLAGAQFSQFFYQNGYVELGTDQYRFEVAGNAVVFTFFHRNYRRNLMITRSSKQVGEYNYIRLTTKMHNVEKEDLSLLQSYPCSAEIRLNKQSSSMQVAELLGISHVVGEEEFQFALALCLTDSNVLVVEQNDQSAGFNIRYNPPNWMYSLATNPL